MKGGTVIKGTMHVLLRSTAVKLQFSFIMRDETSQGLAARLLQFCQFQSVLRAVQLNRVLKLQNSMLSFILFYESRFSDSIRFHANVGTLHLYMMILQLSSEYRTYPKVPMVGCNTHKLHLKVPKMIKLHTKLSSTAYSVYSTIKDERISLKYATVLGYINDLRTIFHNITQ